MKHSDRAAARGFKLSPHTLGGRKSQDPAKGEVGGGGGGGGGLHIFTVTCGFSPLFASRRARLLH